MSSTGNSVNRQTGQNVAHLSDVLDEVGGGPGEQVALVAANVLPRRLDQENGFYATSTALAKMIRLSTAVD